MQGLNNFPQRIREDIEQEIASADLDRLKLLSDYLSDELVREEDGKSLLGLETFGDPNYGLLSEFTKTINAIDDILGSNSTPETKKDALNAVIVAIDDKIDEIAATTKIMEDLDGLSGNEIGNLASVAIESWQLKQNIEDFMEELEKDEKSKPLKKTIEKLKKSEVPGTKIIRYILKAILNIAQNKKGEVEIGAAQENKLKATLKTLQSKEGKIDFRTSQEQKERIRDSQLGDIMAKLSPEEKAKIFNDLKSALEHREKTEGASQLPSISLAPPTTLVQQPEVIGELSKNQRVELIDGLQGIRTNQGEVQQSAPVRKAPPIPVDAQGKAQKRKLPRELEENAQRKFYGDHGSTKPGSKFTSSSLASHHKNEGKVR